MTLAPGNMEGGLSCSQILSIEEQELFRGDVIRTKLMAPLGNIFWRCTFRPSDNNPKRQKDQSAKDPSV
jgi:hypothetical protein